MAAKRWNILAAIIAENGLKCGAEVGVKSGRNLARISQQVPDFHWIAVDPWEPTENYARWPDSSHAKHEAEFDRWAQRAKTKPRKLKMFSVEAAALVEDGSLDLVFIDGDHSYEGVRADIDAWLPKVRPGGFIAGHDYDNTNKYGDAFKGVDRAVDETFGDQVRLEADHVWIVQV